ncbi:MAG: hypothetical protein NVSMB32_10600 [Actinomycetota bacterium]
MEGDPGSGQVIVNGAAARLVAPGDKVIIVAYVELEEGEARLHQPRVVLVDAANRPITGSLHAPGQPLAP